jgi:hypothetical protein
MKAGAKEFPFRGYRVPTKIGLYIFVEIKNQKYATIRLPHRLQWQV